MIEINLFIKLKEACFIISKDLKSIRKCKVGFGLSEEKVIFVEYVSHASGSAAGCGS